MFEKFGRICRIAFYNFRQWKRNTRIIATFILTFILCFLLTDKTVNFAVEHGTTMQLVEAFIWTFGDSNSILLSSLLLLLLYAEMPFITAATPFFLVRGTRNIWVLGQMIYICIATFIYLIFILVSTCLLCVRVSFAGNTWSKTAAVLAYSDEGDKVALPAVSKILEMSRPYQAVMGILALMLMYTLVLVFVMLFFTIWKGQIVGVVSVLVFSVYGLLLNPENIKAILKLPDALYYKARVWVGWVSPLNHATYSMHSFGYDNLPTLQQTGLIFAVILAVLTILTMGVMRRYSFQFKGVES